MMLEVPLCPSAPFFSYFALINMLRQKLSERSKIGEISYVELEWLLYALIILRVSYCTKVRNKSAIIFQLANGY